MNSCCDGLVISKRHRNLKDGGGGWMKTLFMFTSFSDYLGNKCHLKWLGVAFRGLSNLSEKAQLKGMENIHLAIIFTGIVSILTVIACALKFFV